MSIIDSKEYDFLWNNKLFSDKICLLCYGGSYAYGIERESSDVDIRGIALNSKEDILLGRDFESFEDTETDTKIYSLPKAVDLLLGCNPSIIEMLGCCYDHYFILSSVGRMLIDSRKSFLSKKCINTFNGYVSEHLNQLKTVISESDMIDDKLRSINGAMNNFDSRFGLNEFNFNIYRDGSELLIDTDLKGYPVNKFISAVSDIGSILRGYGKMKKRNRCAINHGKINKHMANLLRIYMMGIDILSTQEIRTHRSEDERHLLLSIYNGDYTEDNRPSEKFFDIFDSYKLKYENAVKSTTLPDEPDYDLVYKKLAYINESVVKGVI